jgi:hypothetical protein
MRIARLAALTTLLFVFPFQLGAQERSPSLPTVTKFDCPKYPDKARSAHISGTVKMQVTTDGHSVSEVKIISGPSILARAAEDNVRTWKFADHPPTTLTVTYVYTNEGDYKKDPVTKCEAKMDLPTQVTVSTKIPFLN